MCESNAKSSTPKSRKARSYDPFNEFMNSVHLTKSCGSGLLLNNLRDPSIIDRPILISYVSIAATRTYEVGHVRPLCAHIRMYLLVLSSSRVKRNRVRPDSTCPILILFPSYPCFLARSWIQGEDEVNQMHAVTRILGSILKNDYINSYYNYRYYQWTKLRRRQARARSTRTYTHE